ncbi:MAG TPA: energy transducer TonB, partial [Longimicrobiaceae bacterium]|nr:energy transducer TonB [Longimicrobiaceae bacterium]
LPAPLPTILLGSAVLIAMLGAIAPAFPPLVLALVTGVLLFAGNRFSRGGRLAPWATALTLVLVMIGIAGPGRQDPWPELEPPPVAVPDVEPLPIGGIGDPGPPTDSWGVDRRPVLLDPEEFADVVATLPLDVPARSGPDSVVLLLFFTVDEEGRIAPGSASFTGVSAAELDRLLRDVRFEPALLDGRPVRMKTFVTVRPVGGRAIVILDKDRLPGYGPGFDVDRSPQESPTDVADAEVKPRLLNTREVQGVLQELYPPLLRDAGVTGQTHVKFVIDARGRVDPASVVTVSATHSAFAEASLEVVSRMRFSPARVEGREVPVLVQIPITWTLERG